MGPSPATSHRNRCLCRHQQRNQVVAQYAERHTVLKAIPTAATPGRPQVAVRALARLPRNASPLRVRNPGQDVGCLRGFVSKVGLSRINLPTRAHRGELPGIPQSSW